MYWFNLKWWKYLLSKPASEISYWTAFHCRRKGHPCGVIWFDTNGLDPNMSCKNCYDDLG